MLCLGWPVFKLKVYQQNIKEELNVTTHHPQHIFFSSLLLNFTCYDTLKIDHSNRYYLDI